MKLGRFELTRKLGTFTSLELSHPYNTQAGEFAQVFECVKREDRAKVRLQGHPEGTVQRHASFTAKATSSASTPRLGL